LIGIPQFFVLGVKNHFDSESSSFVTKYHQNPNISTTIADFSVNYPDTDVSGNPVMILTY